MTTYAFIDSQNLNLAIREIGWKLDFKRFRTYLYDTHEVKKAFLFIGYTDGQQTLYKALQEYGYVLIFKPTLRLRDGSVKGNVDAELVLHAMLEYNRYDNAVIVTGDGDFHCLLEHLENHGKLRCLLIPNREKYSALLRKFKNKSYVSDLKGKLQHTETRLK